jgi:tripartite-type tricarboxylate transporter receptor subunit TctC
MRLPRRGALLGLAGTLVAPRPSRADAVWPEQPIRIVVPYPPGALTDVLGRMVAERFQKAFGQPVIVDNRAGAGTLLGASAVAKQPADGYTLLLATVTTLCIAPALYAKPLATHTDFTGVAKLGDVTLFLLARPDLAVATPRDLVTLLRAKPGGYTFGSPGIGSVHHLLTELILSRERLSAVHVPYQGSVKAVGDLMEGRLDFMFLDATVALPQLSTGKLKALAVTGTHPMPELPAVPALTEFFPGLDAQPWMSIAAPAGTPAAILSKLNGEVNSALADASFAGRLRQIGVAPTPLTLAAFNDFIAAEVVRWTDMVRLSGAKAE